MKNCTITASIRGGRSITTSFPIKKNTPEYLIADEAYKFAMMFAETQVIATYGECTLSGLMDALQKLEYDYKIS